MDKKNLMFQATQPINKLTIEYLPSELAELSEEDLSQVKGGSLPCFCCRFWPDDRLQLSNDKIKTSVL
jgi:bacteriocin leader peptide (microcyclamide/patellamide family)